MDKTMQAGEMQILQNGKMVKKFIVIPVSFLPLEKKLSLLSYVLNHLPSEWFFQFALDTAAEISFQLSGEADDSFPTLPFILIPLIPHLHHESGNSLIPLLDAPKHLSPVSKPPPSPQPAFIASLTCEGGPNEVGDAL